MIDSSGPEKEGYAQKKNKCDTLIRVVGHVDDPEILCLAQRVDFFITSNGRCAVGRPWEGSGKTWGTLGGTGEELVEIPEGLWETLGNPKGISEGPFGAHLAALALGQREM